MNNDYSQIELDNIIEELLTVHDSKLKCIEYLFLKQKQHENLNQEDRDTIISMYDRMGEAGY